MILRWEKFTFTTVPLIKKYKHFLNLMAKNRDYTSRRALLGLCKRLSKLKIIALQESLYLTLWSFAFNGQVSKFNMTQPWGPLSNMNVSPALKYWKSHNSRFNTPNFSRDQYHQDKLYRQTQTFFPIHLTIVLMGFNPFSDWT